MFCALHGIAEGKTLEYMQNILFIILNALILYIQNSILSNITTRLRSRTQPKCKIYAQCKWAPHTHKARAAMAKIECISKCISNRADAFRLFAILQWNCIAAMRVFPHLFYVAIDNICAGFVSSDHISKIKCNDFTCVCVFSVRLCAANAFQMLQRDTMEAEKQEKKKTQRYTFVTFRQSWRVHLSHSIQPPKTNQRINGDGWVWRGRGNSSTYTFSSVLRITKWRRLHALINILLQML